MTGDVHDLPQYGDTAEYAWLQGFLNRCFPVVRDKVTADFQLVLAMCKADPKHAQTGMQMLAQTIRDKGEDMPADGMAFMRFALGVLFTGYCGVAVAEGRASTAKIPAELQFIVAHNPEIVQCANELGPIS